LARRGDNKVQYLLGRISTRDLLNIMMQVLPYQAVIGLYMYAV